MQVPSFALAAFAAAALAQDALAQCGLQEIGPPPDTTSTASSQFGRAAGVSGNIAVVGARVALGPGTTTTSYIPDIAPLGPHPPSSATTPGSGTGVFGVAYVFHKLPAGWAQVAALQTTDGDPVDDFGAAVAVDGGLIAVANPHDDDFGPDSGSVYLYQDFGSGPVFAAKLHASDAGPNGRFGASVAVDGGRIVVGAPGASSPSLVPGVGAAYVFEPLLPGLWIEVERLSDSLGQTGDGLGSAVALDGAQALIGAPGSSFPFFKSGAVYAAVQSSPGTWFFTAKLGASDPSPQAVFGTSVALEGALAAIGAPGKNALCSGCGGAYLFGSAGFGAWVQVAQLGQALAAGDLVAGDAFGTAVALGNGVAAVSAPKNDAQGLDSGTVFAFQQGLTGYILTGKFNACPPPAAAPAFFGQALDAEGGTLLAGAPGVAATGQRGAAYFAALETIELSNDSIALFFSEPGAGPALAAAMAGSPGVDPDCSADPLYPQVEIEDRFDNNPLFSGHRYVLKGRIWELSLIGQPILPGTFDFSGYDTSAEEELFKATPKDCDGEVEFDVQYDVPDPQDGSVTGTLATFAWTDCEAEDASSAVKGPFRVDLQVFVPQGQGNARFDLTAEATGPAPSWAFWCGKLNLSVVEDHLGSEPGAEFHLLTPFGHLVKDPALHLIATAGIPPRADALGRPSNQTLGFYDDQGRGLYAAMSDPTGNRAKSFQFYGCPGDGSANPLVNIVSLSFQDDVSPGAPFKAVPSFIGRFRGDWYDMAQLYRDWLLADSEMTANGLVKDRPDVPAFAKRILMAGVLGAGVVDYTGKSLDGFETRFPSGTVGVGGTTELLPTGEHPTDTVPERIDEYMEHYDLPRMIVLQFATGWADGGCAGIGEYGPTAQFAEDAALMQDKEEELAAEGKELKYMLYFLDAMHSTDDLPGGSSIDWEAVTVRNPVLDPVYLSWPDCGFESLALMDPSSAAWQTHLFDVSAVLGSLGVDGIYCDNAFPDLHEYDFATDHGHAPGFGPYMTKGFGDMFDAIQAGGASGNPGLDPDFITYTEFFFEGFIPRSDTYGPEQLRTDWMTADEDTLTVPLISTLYHDYTILGPPFVGTFTHDIPPLSNPDHVLNLFSAAEREKGRRSANLTMAFGWVAGCPIWCPDPAFADPVKKRFSYELYALELAGKLKLPPTFSFAQLAAVCDFGAQLARVRGYPLVEPFLTVGQRLRDLGDFATVPPSVSASLAEIFNPYNPGGALLGPEVESFPAIQHGVWRDLTTGYVGIALANFTAAPATATFTIDPALYGFAGPVGVYAVGPGGETLYHAAFSGPTEIDVALEHEQALFLRVRP